MSPAEAGQTPVRFTLKYSARTHERVVIVGSVPELGGWDPPRGLEMAKDRGQWRAVAWLPTGSQIYYKYVIRRVSTESELTGRGSIDDIQWEIIDGDRSISVTGMNMKIDDNEFGLYNQNDRNRVKGSGVTPRRSTPSTPASPSEALVRRGTDSPFLDESVQSENVIVALYRLPIRSMRVDGVWSFHWDDDALYFTSSGVRRELGEKVKWVGILNTDEEIALAEQELISKELQEKFKCFPVFLARDTIKEFYEGFCKGVLWPAFHMCSNVVDEASKMTNFDFKLWEVYKRVNFQFAEVVEANFQVGDVVWIHDYHLMILPAALRINLPGARLGFFLHIPWPSSETYRELPVRFEILRGLLASNLLGFHLFDYARHFLSAGRRLLNLEHEARRGLLGVEYQGRHVDIRVSHVGVDPTRFKSALEGEAVRTRVKDLQEQHKDRWILGAIDDMDTLKGISLKLLSFESLLQNYHVFRNKMVLIQVAIPKKARLKQVVRDEIHELVDRINESYGTESYTPVVYVEEDISFEERVALYHVFDTLLLTPVRDGLNLVPYEYIVSSAEGKGQLIISEFTGCSKALSGAVRINPWNTPVILQKIDTARHTAPSVIEERRQADFNYVTAHSTGQWVESFISDLRNSNSSKGKLIQLGTAAPGLGPLEFEGFARLHMEGVSREYRRSSSRLFLLDYDGTLTPNIDRGQMSHAWAAPTRKVRKALDALASDPKNTVFIMSGRTRQVLTEVFSSSAQIGVAAEHGLECRFPGEDWKLSETKHDLTWITTAKDIMDTYSARTDGAYVEEKSSGLVWHWGDADPEFGTWQSKELQNHLENVLASFKVQVLVGKNWLQVRLADVNKAEMTQRVLDWLRTNGRSPNFIFCAGDDRTDEDMFKLLGEIEAQVFTCVVGMKPSNARYYVRQEDGVARLLVGLTAETADKRLSMDDFASLTIG